MYSTMAVNTDIFSNYKLIRFSKVQNNPTCKKHPMEVF